MVFELHQYYVSPLLLHLWTVGTFKLFTSTTGIMYENRLILLKVQSSELILLSYGQAAPIIYLTCSINDPKRKVTIIYNF